MDYKGFYDYRVEVYHKAKYLGTFGYVTNLRFLTLWLNIHFLYWKWTSIRVYHRISNTYIGEFKRGDALPPKPQP